MHGAAGDGHRIMREFAAGGIDAREFYFLFIVEARKNAGNRTGDQRLPFAWGSDQQEIVPPGR